MIKRKLRKWLKEKKLNELDTFYYDLFVNKIKNNINFSFCRFGDGEWNAIIDVEGENCDGHQYFDDMGAALRKCFDGQRSYYMGIQPLSIRTMLSHVSPFAFSHNQRYFNADIFHKASEFGMISSFFEALKEREIVLVGPAYLKDINKIKLSRHVVIPEKNCWLERDNTLNELRKELIGKDGTVVLFTASMASNVYIDILHAEYGDKFSFFDVGSLLDPFVGRHTRGYHKKLNY